MTTAALAAALVLLLARPLAHPPVRRPGASADVGGRQCGRRSRLVPARSRRTDPADVASWCDRLARSVRSGSSLAAAVRRVDPPVGGDATVDAILRSTARGSSLAEATRVPTDDPSLAAALAVLHACASLGGPTAEPLDRVAATLRTRAAEAAELRTASAQARWSAHVMTVLPFAMLGLLVVGSPAVRSAVATPVGAALVSIGTALNIAGWWWMRRLVRGVLR
jgi:tight adherence protein B